MFLIYWVTNVTHLEFVLQNHKMLLAVTVAQFELGPKHIGCYKIVSALQALIFQIEHLA